MADLVAAPHCCQEASTLSRETYLPCNQPATQRLRAGKNEYIMCDPCAHHNLTRGFKIVGPYIAPTAADLRPKAKRLAAAKPVAASEVDVSTLRNSIDTVRALAKIDNETEQLTKRMKALAEKREMLEPRVLDYLTQQGVDNIKMEGRVIYTRVDVRASVDTHAAKEDVVEAFTAAGVGDLIKPTVNANSLAAYVREQRKLDRPLSNAIAAVINVHDITKVSSRKAEAKKKAPKPE